MKPLSGTASDEALIEFVDGWAALLEAEDYEAAFAYTAHVPEMHWTPALMSEAVKGYGDARPNQKVTLHGVPSDVSQRKDVMRVKPNAYRAVAEIWYDLNIDGVATDLTATFRVVQGRDGLTIYLSDIHVM